MIRGIFFTDNFNARVLNVPLITGALVISLLSEPLATSPISFNVERFPSESKNIITLASLGTPSITFTHCVLNSSTVATGYIINLSVSIPLSVIISVVNAPSLSQYKIIPSLLVSKKFLAILNAKNVLPTDSEPARQVILFDGIPPYIEPDNKAFKEKDPVSKKVLQSPRIPADTADAISFELSFINCLTKLFTAIIYLLSHFERNFGFLLN